MLSGVYRFPAIDSVLFGKPFVEALGHYVSVCPEDDLKEQVGAHGGELARLVPRLSERLPGVVPEFVEEPEERPYGIDAGFRDPSGNHLRLTQVTMAGV